MVIDRWKATCDPLKKNDSESISLIYSTFSIGRNSAQGHEGDDDGSDRRKAEYDPL